MPSTIWRLGVGCVILLLFVAGIGTAAQDPSGEADLVYLDSVEAGAGEDVLVRVNVRNDVPLTSISVPLSYDADMLRLTDVSFTGSVAEYVQTKLISPSDISTADGHFVVAAQILFEDPIPAGDGLFVSLVFKVADLAAIGTSSVIDSLFMPPGGELLLVEAESASSIFPEFISGLITIGQANMAPRFVGLTDQQILEGVPLSLTVVTSDGNRDNLTLSVTNKPTGASFVDHGDGTGTLEWTPGYVGPFSADGSPFSVGFWVGDGDLSNEQTVAFHVVNVNRAPVIDMPADVTIDAGDMVRLPLVATDPDYEDVSWKLLQSPAGSSINTSDEPTFEWQSAITDAGSVELILESSDPQGATDTASVMVTIQSADIYKLTLDSVSVDLGGSVDVDLRLTNQLPVSGFDVLITYDVSASDLIGVTAAGTRSEGFEYFSVTDNYGGQSGHLRIVGLVNDQGQPISSLLPAGSGSLATMSFAITSDLAFENQSIPVVFKQNVVGDTTANTLSDTLGLTIGRDQIVYVDGRINIRSVGTIRIGDINLNGLAYEIGDVIRFTNYFINPFDYGFTLLQYANSDVNQDDDVATLSDLVALINIVVHGGPGAPRTGVTGEPEASIHVLGGADRQTISYMSNLPLGAIVLTVESPQALDMDDFNNLQPDMTVVHHQAGLRQTVLLYSMSGDVLPAGENELLAFDVPETVTIVSAQTATTLGDAVRLTIGSAQELLPGEYVLRQNYPNPFNPETTIDFDIPTASRVRLTVFNVLGQTVRTLADGQFEAGRHSLRWDGRDDTGSPVSSGIYLYRLDTDAKSLTRKMVLLK